MTVWLPLESNPDTINPFLESIGVKGVECVDVYSFDDEMIAMLPSSQHALLLCFPDYKKVDEIMKPTYDKMKDEGATVPPGVFFMQQKISNACGTFALFHGLANNEGKIDLGSGSFRAFLDKAKGLKPSEISDLMANSQEIASAHESAAKGGETEAPPAEKVEHHFICFVNKDGTLYEIDSRAPFPRPLGPCEGSLVKAASSEVKKLMEKMANISFGALAIVDKQ